MKVAVPDQAPNQASARTDQATTSQYVFGAFTLQPDGSLVHHGLHIALPLKELLVLRCLLAHAGRIVSAAELHQAAWGDVHVSADSLPRCISSLRARFESEECIQTVYKRGYRFSTPVFCIPQRAQMPLVQHQALRTMHRTVLSSAMEMEELQDTPHGEAIPAQTLPRLAILPFVTSDGVPHFLGEGVAEETMLRLGRTGPPVAEILARDSVFALVASGISASQVCATLQADLAVTGTIAALPLHYRLRAEMFRARDSVQLWSEEFIVPRTELAVADARMAKRIGARIRNAFLAPSGARGPALVTNKKSRLPIPINQRDSRRGEAYAMEMQARADWKTFRQDAMQNALRGFQHALELDHELHSARVQLMHSYLALASFGFMPGDEAAELARAEANHLRIHAPLGHSAHATLGWIHFFHDRDLDAAAASFARPSGAGYDPWTPVYLSRFALGQGRITEAITLLRSALEHDPFSTALNWRLAWALHLDDNTEAAIAQARHALHLFPTDPGTLFFAATIFATASMPTHGKQNATETELGERAVSLATRLVQAAPALDAGMSTLAYAHARQGRIVEARALLDHQQWVGRQRFVLRSFQAPALLELGEHDAALEALKDAEQRHCPWLFELLGDPRLKPLHREAEFHRLGQLAGYRFATDASVA